MQRLALFPFLAVGMLWLASFAPACAAEAPTLTLRSPHHACHNAVIRFILPSGLKQRLFGRQGGSLVLERNTKGSREWLLCQVGLENGQALATFVLPDLAAGETQVYALRRIHSPLAQSVRVVPKGETADVFLGPSLFTRYGTTKGANKPFFYPILTPNGHSITRRWPMETIPGESRDHPHHRGLWFTHGSVNGIDFWSEGQGTGRTTTTAIEDIASGPVYGGFRAKTEWRAPDGKLLANDTREVLIYPLPDGSRLLDFTITLTPVGGPLVFGDTKEGTFGLRLADSLALTGKQGAHILTSSGQRDGNAWGKPADWVDDYGPLGGQIYGVAILDHPGNLRHPPGWHARDYGLDRKSVV